MYYRNITISKKKKCIVILERIMAVFSVQQDKYSLFTFWFQDCYNHLSSVSVLSVQVPVVRLRSIQCQNAFQNGMCLSMITSR